MWKRAAIALAIAIPVLGIVSGDTAHAGGGCHSVAPGFSDSRSTAVSMNECKFIPAVVRVDPGASVQWTNDDNVTHMVAGVAGSWGKPEQYDTGDGVTHAFDKPGVYPYYCELHPGMVGAVVVGDGAAASNAGNAGDLAVSADVADAGAPEAAHRAAGGDDGFDSTALAVAGVAALLIGGAALLGLLRLTRRIPRP